MADRLGLPEWEISGEPVPNKFYWLMRRDLAQRAIAAAQRPLGEKH